MNQRAPAQPAPPQDAAERRTSTASPVAPVPPVLPVPIDRTRAWFLIAAVVAASVSACRCSGEQERRAHGKPQRHSNGQSGQQTGGGGGGSSSSMSIPSDLDEDTFRRWLLAETGEVKKLAMASELAYWKATASGRQEDYSEWAAAELAKKQHYSNRSLYTYLRLQREAGIVRDPVLERQLDVLYQSSLPNQLDEKMLEAMVSSSADLENRFNTFRAEIDGKRVSDNDIERVLAESNDSKERRQAWEASKGVGALLAGDVIKLVKLRNQAARQLGFSDYYELALVVEDLDETTLNALLDELARQTDEPFRRVKAELDKTLAARFEIPVTDLRPWHYGDRFFQEPPASDDAIDSWYHGRNVVELALRYYESLGLPARKVIERSDLQGREGKYQHAYCTNIDRDGDVRVMVSVVDNAYWMDTLLHELGHAVYSLGSTSDPALPYLLREAASSFTTEGVAILMGRFASNPYWIQRMQTTDPSPGSSPPPAAGGARTHGCLGALVFARWGLVVVKFERELYRNPDQDL
ncbi:MAG: M2 family metallopeptidase, partial [Pseudomonadota bacterium]